MSKRYLTTPGEVVQALKEGKVVVGKQYKYKLIDGIICSLNEKQGCHRWTVGDTIFDSETPHIEESEPLKLEVGKFYRTRGGKKVIVLYIDKNNTTGFPIRVVVIDCSNAPYFVKRNGDYSNTYDSDWDLVAPWEE